MPSASRDQIERLRKEYAKNPESRTFVHLAEAYRTAGELERAREVLTQGLQRHPDYSSALVVLARVLTDQGEYVQAEAAWRRVVALDPENVSALRALGDIADLTGRREEAKDFYRQVVRLENAELDEAPGEPVVEPAVDAAAEPAVEPEILAEAGAEPPLDTPPGAAGIPDGAPAAESVPEPADAGPEPVAPPAPPLEEPVQRVVVPPPPPRTGPAPAGARETPGLPRRAPVAAPPPVARGNIVAEAGTDALGLAALLVRLLEKDGPVVHARSSLRRLLAAAIGRELEVDEEEAGTLALSALLAEVGEISLGGTLPFPGGADRDLAVSLHLLQNVPLPAAVRAAVTHQHEHWDGGGLPGGLRGKEIPLPARVLAVARSVTELLLGDSPEVGAVLAETERRAGSAFDPVVVGALRRVFAQRERHGIGYRAGGRVCIVHPDELRTLALATELHTRGYTVEVAPGGAAVRDAVHQGTPAALVMGAALPDGEPAGLVREVRASAGVASLPIVVVDAPGPEQRMALLSAGADLCFPPQTGFPELSASLNALLRRTEGMHARPR